MNVTIRLIWGIVWKCTKTRWQGCAHLTSHLTFVRYTPHGLYGNKSLVRTVTITIGMWVKKPTLLDGRLYGVFVRKSLPCISLLSYCFLFCPSFHSLSFFFCLLHVFHFNSLFLITPLFLRLSFIMYTFISVFFILFFLLPMLSLIL